MRVKCIKDTIHFKKWEIFNTETEWICSNDWTMYSHKWQEFPDYFQEVKEEEENLPKWKVGQYIIRHYNNWEIEARILRDLCFVWGRWEYNWMPEAYYRDPTPEELSLYFK